MKKEQEAPQEPEVNAGWQDEFAGQGGSYIYDPVTKTRKPIIEEEGQK